MNNNAKTVAYLIRKANNVSGIYITDGNSCNVVDMPDNQLIESIKNGSVKLENVTVSEGKLVGTNGSLSRYARPINGQFMDSNIIILSELYDSKNNAIGYKLCTPTGKTYKYSKKKVINLLSKLQANFGRVDGWTPVANGKVVTKDGTSFVSAIKGEYIKEVYITKEEASKSKASQSGTVEVTEKSLNLLFKAVALAQTDGRLNISKSIRTAREYLDKNGVSYEKGNDAVIPYTAGTDAKLVFLKQNKDIAGKILSDLRYTGSVEGMASKFCFGSGSFSYALENHETVDLTSQYRSWSASRPVVTVPTLLQSLR